MPSRNFGVRWLANAFHNGQTNREAGRFESEGEPFALQRRATMKLYLHISMLLIAC